MILKYKKLVNDKIKNYTVHLSYKQLELDNNLLVKKKKLFSDLYELKSVKHLSKIEATTLGHVIRDYKDKLKSSDFQSYYNLTVTIGKNLLEYTLSEAPNTSTIKDCIEELIAAMGEKRRDNKVMDTEDKEYFGMNYSTVGGVFTKSGSVLRMLQDINYMDRIQCEKKPHPLIKDHHVGIEIEMNMKSSRSELDQLFIDAKLSGFVKNKGDGSIQHRDDENPIEVTALFKQARTNEMVNAICNVIKKAKGSVNNSCGLHVHLDMRNRNAEIAYNNLYMCLPIINAITPPNRVSGDWSKRYCAQNTYPTLAEQTSHGGRYWAINTQSLREHKTLEVRIHSGTVNATKIINFIKLLAMIVDHAKLDSKVTTMESFRTLFPEMSAELYDYLLKRQDTMSNKKVVDTLTDISTDEQYLEVAV